MHSIISRTGVVAASIALVTAVFAPGASAKTIVVDNTLDHVGSCDVVEDCTLRTAILDAVATPGRDVITFSPSVFPVGAPAAIYVESALPAIVDPAGTAIDGTGASVLILSQIPTHDDGPLADGLVFASTPGVPLRDVAVTNVTVIGFEASGVVICGGSYPECDQDVVAPVVRRVTSKLNTAVGIFVRGRNVTKARIDECAATSNDAGVLMNAFGTLSGTRITRSAMKQNDFAGIWIGPLTGTISDLAISDTSVSDGSAAMIVAAVDDARKVSLTNVAVTGGEGFGILVSVPTLSALSVTNVVSSRNGSDGILVSANAIDGVVLKDVVTNANEHGVRFLSDRMVGAKITQVTAANNTKDGLTLLETTGAKISRVAVADNGGHGLVVQGDGNVLKHVRAAENVGDGVHLGGPGRGNTVTGVSSAANQGAGIYVEGNSVGNTLKKNVALGSDSIDLFDANPACDGNAWKGNVFELRNVACIR